MGSLQNQMDELPLGIPFGTAMSVEELDDASMDDAAVRPRQETWDEQVDSPLDTYLVNPETVVKNRWTLHLVFCSFSAVVGSTFIFPYNAGLLNEPELILKKFINQSFFEQFQQYPDSGTLENLWSWTVSLFLFGGLIGGLVGGVESSRLGRKRSLMLNSAIGIISGVLMFIAPHVNIFELLMAGRFVAGIQCGAVTAIVPAYLTELAPLSLRGATATVNLLSLTCGGLVAGLLGLPDILGKENAWPFLFFPCILLPSLQILLLIFCVESPLWLMMVKRDESETMAAVKKLREPELPIEAIEAEVAYLRNERDAQDALPPLTFWQSFVGSLGWPLVICVMMQLAQCGSGFVALAYYSTEMLEKVFDDPIPQYASLGIPSTTVLVAIVGIFVIERAGRRVLMLIGVIGLWIACILITIFRSLAYISVVFNYLTVVLFFVFAGIFALGPGSIPWYLAPELTLPQFRLPTIAICTFVNWAGQCAIGLGFPEAERALGNYSFLPFAGVLTVCMVFSVLFLPETKGLSAEESIRRLSVRKLQLECGRELALDQMSSSNFKL